MSEIFEIEAQGRDDMGKGASRRLRRSGRVPGIVYGAHKNPQLISLLHSDLLQHLEHEAFYSHILQLKVDGKNQKVILKDMQRHPAKPFIMHVDFLRVSMKEKLKTHVPLHFINESKSAGVKLGGVVSHHITDLEVVCLPKDLPEFIEVDILELGMGESILMSGVQLPKGLELPALASGAAENDLPVVSIHGAHVASEEHDEPEAEIGETAGSEDEA